MYGLIQHPDITRAEKYGIEENSICCPICGEECETFYKRLNDVLGCEKCIDEVDAYEHVQDMDEEARVFLDDVD